MASRNREKPVYAKYIEHIPPDTTAAIFWLKNRDPQHWRDSQQLEHCSENILFPINR